jgi:Ca2+-binding RTX toxin-like protein
MSVTLTAAGDEAALSYDSFDHQLLVNGDVCGGAGGLALNDNVDKIVVHDTSAGGTKVIIEDPTAFAPGATEEGPLNAPEIEFELSMGGGSDHLVLRGSDAAEAFTFGTNGVNTGAGALDFDLEVTGSGVDEITAHGDDGGDEISGQGGRGTGDPIQLPMHLHGEGFDDALAGGDGSDDLHGGPDGDALEGGLGTDYLDGGTSDDVVSYAHATSAVRVALDASEPLQQTGGAGADHLVALETLAGSAHDDELRTMLVGGEVDGGAGGDRITGSAAAETLYGGQGDDVIDPGPEATVHDFVFGGIGFDTVTYARAPKAVDVNLPTDSGNPRDGIGSGDELSGIDAIEGSLFADRLQGDDGANTIDGLAGTDQINARGSADFVRARDGAADSVDCGDGEDSAVADIRTLDSLTGCEAADFSPDPAAGGEPQQPAVGGSAADTTLRLSVSARRGQRLLRTRAVLATVHCAGEPCKVRTGGTLGGIRLRSVTRSVAPDTRTRVRVPLSSRAVRRIRAALADGRRPRLTLSVRATDAAGNTVIRKRSILARQA